MNVVGAYYDEKTNRIIEKYGSEFRIHYHSGILDEPYQVGNSTTAIRLKMHRYQENVLSLMSRYMPQVNKQYKVLDVGCGLGGGSLYWAMEKNVKVTAVTVAQNHVEVIKNYAKKAGVEHLIVPQVQDANTMPGSNNYDMAVSIESSCYLDRTVWFKRMYGLLRSGGILQICDWILSNEEYKMDQEVRTVEEHWKTDMGTVSEYLKMANSAGFETLVKATLNDHSADFWKLAIDWNEQKKKENKLSEKEINRLNLSSESIKILYSCFKHEKILLNHFVFRK